MIQTPPHHLSKKHQIISVDHFFLSKKAEDHTHKIKKETNQDLWVALPLSPPSQLNSEGRPGPDPITWAAVSLQTARRVNYMSGGSVLSKNEQITIHKVNLTNALIAQER